MDFTEESLMRVLVSMQRRRCPHRPMSFKPKFIVLCKPKLSARHRMRTGKVKT